MIVPRYVPGDWNAVVADGALALLPPGTLPAVVELLWRTLRTQGDLDEVLGLLAARRSRGARGFALVDVAGGEVRAYLRGDVELRAGSGRSVAGQGHGESGGLHAVGGADGWVGVHWADVDEVTVRTVVPADGLDDAESQGRAEHALPVLSGIVRADAVTVSMRAQDGVLTPDDADDADDVSPSAEADAPVDAGATQEPEGAAREGDLDPEDWIVGDTILAISPALRAQAAQGAGASDDARGAGTTGTTGTGGGDAGADGATGAAGAPAPAAAEASGTTPLPGAGHRAAPTLPDVVHAGARLAAYDDHDGTTIMSSDLVEIRRRLSSWSEPQVPGPFAVPTATPPAKIVMSTGAVVNLDRPVLIGRAPVVSRVANRDLPRLVTVASPHHDISRTHAQITTDGDRVMLVDLDSTNGVILHARGTSPVRIRPGVPTELPLDATVDIGDGVTFRLMRA